MAPGRRAHQLTQSHEATKGKPNPGPAHFVILVALCETRFFCWSMAGGTCPTDLSYDPTPHLPRDPQNTETNRHTRMRNVYLWPRFCVFAGIYVLSARFFLRFAGECVHNVHMRVIGKPLLESFWKKHPQARNPLVRWVDIVEGTLWGSFADIRRTFRSADLYHDGGVRYVVFNVAGNKFRLTATIQYARRSIQGTVVISQIETHPEYDKHR